MKKPRKKISKLGWGVRWGSGKIEFFSAKKKALREVNYRPTGDMILFRCKIEELAK